MTRYYDQIRKYDDIRKIATGQGLPNSRSERQRFLMASEILKFLI